MARPPGRKNFEGRKVPVNWTLDPEAYNVITAAKKANPDRSLSELVSYAITHTYTDPLEEATTKAKYHAAETQRWLDIKHKLEDEKKAKR